MYLISIALLCGAVHGWDKQGHRLAGRVASKLLTGRAKSFLYDHIVEGDVSSVAAAVSAVSSWADEEGRELYPRSRQLHFSFTDEKRCSPFEFNRDCGFDGSKECIVTGIAKYMAEAVDPSISASKRADAIKFLIHLVADAHHPLHVGFRGDYGGNNIDIRLENPIESWRDIPTNLHQVWDGYLTDVYRTKNEGLSWWRLGNKLSIEYSNKEHFMLPALKSTQMGYDFAVDIVSETATEVTCKFAYSDEAGRYIERNDVLSDAYIERGINVMKVQLVKAGVRLAQALNLAATTYYSAIDPKLSAAEPTKPRENGFAALGEVNSDSTELAYFVDSESDDESTIQSVREPEKPTNSENPKPIRSERVDHIDWNSVVLLRRATGLYVTYKHFVTSDTFVPKRALCARVSFAEESSSTEIKFDSDLVARFGSKLSDELVIALVRKVYRLPDFDNNTEMKGGEMHVKVVFNHFDTLIHNLESTVPREGSGGVFFNLNAPYSVVAPLVKPRPTRAALVREFGERILDEPEDKIHFRLLLAIKDLVVVTSPDIHVVTTEAYLKNASNRRWAFHAFFNNDDQVVLVDVRLFDFTLTPDMLKFLNRWHRVPGNEERVKRIQGDHPWIIFGIQSISNGMRTGSLVDTKNEEVFRMVFESIELVHRAGRFPIVKFITRTHEESFKIMQAFERK